MPEPSLTLRLTNVECSEEALRLSYEAHNAEPHAVFLANRLLRRTPEGPVLDADLVYARLEPGPALRLAKRFCEVPEHMFVGVPHLPRLTPLPAGERFAETLRIPLPVMPSDPYEPQSVGDEVLVVDRLTFELGYVVADEPLPVSEGDLATGGRVWRMGYGDLAMRQRVVTAETGGLAVPTLIDLGQQRELHQAAPR